MELLVVGAGEMGRWVADTVLADDATDATVAFADRNHEVAVEAARSRIHAAANDPPVDGSGNDRAVDAEDGPVDTKDGPIDAKDGPIDVENGPIDVVETDTDRTFDVVCLAVPMSAVPAAVEAYAPICEEAMVDVSGEMTDAIAAMREHVPDRERASYHPLFAPPRVPGNVAVVVDQPGPHVERLTHAIETGGNDVFETTADEHDAAMETVQAGAHAAVLAWRLAGQTVREEFHTPVSEALDGVADTVTEGSPAVYAEIQTAFDGADEVAEAAREIAEADPERFAELYERARGDREGRERHD